MQSGSILDDRSVLALSGPESGGFLQGIVTNDVKACRKGEALYSGLLTPQGKILFDFFIVDHGADRLLIDCSKGRAAELVRRLTLYRLRSKVEILETDMAVAAFWNGTEKLSLPDEFVVFRDPRHLELGTRVIGDASGLKPFVGMDLSHYHAHRLKLGIPDSADLPPDTVFALDTGMGELNGVSFSKGCYVGQEVTARMKHRAHARRRFVIAKTIRAYPPGTPLEGGGRKIGTVATGNGSLALAHVRLDLLAELENHGHPITMMGDPVSLTKPEWLAR